MPANRGGGLRKGQAGKKLQLDRMIEMAKKTQPVSTNHLPLAHKPANGGKKRIDDAKGSSTPKQDNACNRTTTADRAVMAVTPTQPVKSISTKTVTVRLPYLASEAAPKKTLPITYTHPAPVAATVPTPFRNPNHVVVRLPKETSTGPVKEPTTFLSLPNEIRNTIYDLAMPRRKYCVHHIRGKGQGSTELTYHLPPNSAKPDPQLTPSDGKRRRLFDLPKRSYIDKAIPQYRLSPGPAALLLVCKGINEDATPIFYGRNIFYFEAMQPLRKFLDTLRPETRSMVRSLSLVHRTAGNPRETSNEFWKDVYDRSWHNLCFQIRDQCTGLTSLALDLTVSDIPFMMGPLANWMSPLYAFMNLHQLKHINFCLHQSYTEDTVLQVQAYEIRKELMGANFYEASTQMDKIPVEKARPKVDPFCTSLRITGDLRSQPTQRQKPLSNHRIANMTMAELSNLPVHLLPNQLPSLGPGSTVFWHPPSPTGDLPLFPRGEKEAIRKQQLQKKTERLEKKEMAKATRLRKLKAT
ncbi:MAG: hypothetical protein LQ348_007402 [Seirophora lacunosa]|nr:MAG: hypothetical protein LQ348_007402 [Seirophora lacunosa]